VRPSGNLTRPRPKTRHGLGVGVRISDPGSSCARVFQAFPSTKPGLPKRSEWHRSQLPRHSFLPPASGCFLFAFPDAVAVALDQGHVGVVRETIRESGNAGGIGKDFVPFFEWSVGCNNHRLAFVAAVDDFVQQIGRSTFGVAGIVCSHFRSRKANEEARGVSRSSASAMVRRNAGAP